MGAGGEISMCRGPHTGKSLSVRETDSRSTWLELRERVEREEEMSLEVNGADYVVVW